MSSAGNDQAPVTPPRPYSALTCPTTTRISRPANVGRVLGELRRGQPSASRISTPMLHRVHSPLYPFLGCSFFVGGLFTLLLIPAQYAASAFFNGSHRPLTGLLLFMCIPAGLYLELSVRQWPAMMHPGPGTPDDSGGDGGAVELTSDAPPPSGASSGALGLKSKEKAGVVAL